MMKKPGETYSNQGPQCPYCDRQYTADEPFYYDEMNYNDETCDSCGKKFNVSVCISTAWNCEPIDEEVSPDTSD